MKSIASTIYKVAAACLLVLAVSATAAAQSNGIHEKITRMGLEFEINAGTSIGGSSPIPLPAEIRHINSYSPDLDLSLGVVITKWMDPARKWGLAAGVRLETKGMKTKANVKNYGMEILDDGKSLSGRWTGKVQTKYHSQQLVVPITAVYRVHKRLKVSAGPYLAYAFSNDLSGYVFEGYLREGDSTGDKYVFEGDARASYDFGSELRRFQWGIQGGVSWTAYKHLVVNANLSWGCNNIFKSTFKTVSFSLYPIYLNVGFGYVF